jgi:hypothetical protein
MFTRSLECTEGTIKLTRLPVGVPKIDQALYAKLDSRQAIQM